MSLLLPWQKSVNGLLNRVSETNVETTVRDLASLYRGHARQAVDQLVGDTTLRLCISSSQVRLPPKLP